MPFRLGTAELIILMVIVLLLFGVGRIGKVFSEFGKGIRELRRGLSEEEKAEDKPKAQDS
jgi:sec-independent protein translocase protein TatA